MSAPLPPDQQQQQQQLQPERPSHPKPPIIVVEDATMEGTSCNLVSAAKPNIPPRVPQRELNTTYPSNLKPIDKKKIYENNESLRRVRHSKDNIPSESIHMVHLIGEGEFGCVFKGLYLPEQGQAQTVAIKVSCSARRLFSCLLSGQCVWLHCY